MPACKMHVSLAKPKPGFHQVTPQGLLPEDMPINPLYSFRLYLLSFLHLAPSVLIDFNCALDLDNVRPIKPMVGSDGFMAIWHPPRTTTYVSAQSGVPVLRVS